MGSQVKKQKKHRRQIQYLGWPVQRRCFALRVLDDGSLPGCKYLLHKLNMKAAGNCTFLRFLALMYLFPKPSAFKPPLPPGLRDTSPLALNGADLNFKALTKEQHADQGLQFMLSLYRRAADEDGKPRQSRAFGCNTVRLIRPSRPDAGQRRRASGSFGGLLHPLSFPFVYNRHQSIKFYQVLFVFVPTP